MENQLIKDIIFLPKKFYDEGNTSIYSLLKGSGYFELYERVSESGILEVLTQYPECVNQWLDWSENKRTNSGWYFKQDERGKYIVGFFPVIDGLKQIEYSDSKEACADFIIKEIEEIRKS